MKQSAFFKQLATALSLLGIASASSALAQTGATAGTPYSASMRPLPAQDWPQQASPNISYPTMPSTPSNPPSEHSSGKSAYPMVYAAYPGTPPPTGYAYHPVEIIPQTPAARANWIDTCRTHLNIKTPSQNKKKKRRSNQAVETPSIPIPDQCENAFDNHIASSTPPLIRPDGQRLYMLVPDPDNINNYDYEEDTIPRTTVPTRATN